MRHLEGRGGGRNETYEKRKKVKMENLKKIKMELLKKGGEKDTSGRK